MLYSPTLSLKKSNFLIILLLSAILCFLNIRNTAAQTFLVDNRGYIADPKFHQVIKEKGYSLVSAFDTILRKPVIMAATAIKNGQEIRINTKGELFDVKTLKPYYNIPPSTSGSPSSDIPIAGSGNDSKEQYESIFENHKIGTRNKTTHKQGLPIIYDGITWTNHGGILYIKQDGKTGVAKTNGTVLLKPTYEDIEDFGGSGDNPPSIYQIYGNDHKMGLMDRNFKEILAPTYDYIKSCFSCSASENLLIISLNRKQGIANKQGKIVIPPTFDRIEGLGGGHSLVVTNSKLSGLIDTNGKVLLNLDYTKIGRPILGSFIDLMKDNLHGMADDYGNVIVQPMFKNIYPFNKGMAIVQIANYAEGMINKDGKFIIPAEYQHLNRIGNYIITYKAGKYGILNLSGSPVLNAVYDDLRPVDGVFFFKQDGKSGLIDTKGKILQIYNFTDAVFDSGYLIIKKDDKFGVANLQGKIIIPTKYDRFIENSDILRDGTAIAKLNGRVCRVDMYGNEFYQ